MATYVIGDVQGCYAALQSLLQKIQYRPGVDRLGFVGDLINRGPQSLDVLRFVMDQEESYVVLGNHDIYFLIMAHGHIHRSEYKNTLDEVLDAPDCDQLCKWLLQRPLIQEVPEHAALLVHAGIPPQWDIYRAQQLAKECSTMLQSELATDFLANCFGNEPDVWSDTLTGHDRYRYLINAFTRMRFCTADGKLDLDEKSAAHPQPTQFKPWFDWRTGNDPLQILFGHWASLQGKCDRSGIWALDTGCIWGGTLTALRLDDWQLIQVAV